MHSTLESIEMEKAGDSSNTEEHINTHKLADLEPSGQKSSLHQSAVLIASRRLVGIYILVVSVQPKSTKPRPVVKFSRAAACT